MHGSVSPPRIQTNTHKPGLLRADPVGPELYMLGVLEAPGKELFKRRKGQPHEFVPVAILKQPEELGTRKTAKHLFLRFVFRYSFQELVARKLSVEVEASICGIGGVGDS